jgi:hypothetical protein
MADKFQILTGGSPNHVRIVPMSQLHRDSTDSASCSVDQDPITGFEPGMIEEALPGCHC